MEASSPHVDKTIHQKEKWFQRECETNKEIPLELNENFLAW